MSEKNIDNKKIICKSKNGSEKYIMCLNRFSAIIRFISFMVLIIVPFLYNFLECGPAVFFMISAIILFALSDIRLDISKLKDLVIPGVIVYIFGYIFLINYSICSNWYWFIFVTILLIIIGAVIYYYYYLVNKYQILENKNKIKYSLVYVALFYILIDLFYMTFIINSLVARFIFGGLLLIIIYYNLAQVFISDIQIENIVSKSIQKLGLIQDLLGGIILTIYLIFIIPNTILQTIVSTIVAAVYGGLFTLCGVLFEIRKQETVRQQENIEKDKEKKLKYKPLFSIVNYTTTSIQDDYKSFEIKHKKSYSYIISRNHVLNNGEKFYTINNIIIKNSDNSTFFLKTILIDNVKIDNNEKILVNKNEALLIQNFKQILSSNKEFPKIILVMEDILENIYMYEIKLKYQGSELIAFDACEIKNNNIVNNYFQGIKES